MKKKSCMRLDKKERITTTIITTGAKRERKKSQLFDIPEKGVRDYFLIPVALHIKKKMLTSRNLLRNHANRRLADTIDVSLLIRPGASLDIAIVALAHHGAKAVGNFKTGASRGDRVGKFVVSPLIPVKEVEENASLRVGHPVTNLRGGNFAIGVPGHLEVLAVLRVEGLKSSLKALVAGATRGGTSPLGKGGLLHIDASDLEDALHQGVRTAVVAVDLAQIARSSLSVDAILSPGARIAAKSLIEQLS